MVHFLYGNTFKCFTATGTESGALAFLRTTYIGNGLPLTVVMTQFFNRSFSLFFTTEGTILNLGTCGGTSSRYTFDPIACNVVGLGKFYVLQNLAASGTDQIFITGGLTAGGNTFGHGIGVITSAFAEISFSIIVIKVGNRFIFGKGVGSLVGVGFNTNTCNLGVVGAYIDIIVVFASISIGAHDHGNGSLGADVTVSLEDVVCITVTEIAQRCAATNGNNRLLSGGNGSIAFIDQVVFKCKLKVVKISSQANHTDGVGYGRAYSVYKYVVADVDVNVFKVCNILAFLGRHCKVQSICFGCTVQQVAGKGVTCGIVSLAVSDVGQDELTYTATVIKVAVLNNYIVQTAGDQSILAQIYGTHIFDGNFTQYGTDLNAVGITKAECSIVGQSICQNVFQSNVNILIVNVSAVVESAALVEGNAVNGNLVTTVGNGPQTGNYGFFAQIASDSGPNGFILGFCIGINACLCALNGNVFGKGNAFAVSACRQ